MSVNILIENPDQLKKIKFDRQKIPDKLYIVALNFNSDHLNYLLSILPPVSILDINLAGFTQHRKSFFKPDYKIPDSVIEFSLSGIPRLDITGFFDRKSDLRNLIIDILNETKIKRFTDLTGKSLLPSGLVKLQFPFILNNIIPLSQQPELIEIQYSDKQKRIIFD